MVVLSRKERDRQLRRSDILKAAEHIFALKGYHKATIRDIAKDAQYATGTVYIHFKDKSSLYFALFEEKIKPLLSIIKTKTGQEKDAGKKLGIFMQEGLAFFEQNQDFFRIFMFQDNELLAERKFLSSPTGLQMQEYTTNLLKEAQEQGVISRSFDAAQLYEVFIAILKTFVRKWLQEEKRSSDSNELSSIVLKLFLTGATGR